MGRSWMVCPRNAMITIMFPSHVARLVTLADRDLRLQDGQRLFLAGEPVRHLFVVREGVVRMMRRQATGATLVVHRVPPGALVAEASVFAPNYPCDAVATGETLLARIPKARVLALQVQEPSWVQEFAAHLAAEVQRTRARAELLSLKKVGERVDAWASLNQGPIPERGRWAEWAGELGVTPEALYRELARRRP
ncbi:MAG: Crp/Fnr family transcriptional regulator [Variovorax sp.]|nr:MAG: Crp/Fnr family transcriptional regulator [Variovorax sp.]